MKLSVIGCGNMAGAIIGGLISNRVLEAGDITASDPFRTAREKIEKQYGIHTSLTNSDCVKKADVVLLAVKPNVFPAVSEELVHVLEGQLVISIMAGRSIRDLEDGLGRDKKIIRAMPNTPALVGSGITGFCPNANVSGKDLELGRKIIEGFSEAEEVPESLMAVVTSVGGSAPAFVYIFIEAMADAAVAEGMPRKQAYHFAARTVLGSARMVLETGRHPGELKDMVCSPGGTTIEGVVSLEACGFRDSVIEAVRAAAGKAREL